MLQFSCSLRLLFIMLSSLKLHIENNDNNNFELYRFKVGAFFSETLYCTYWATV